MTKKQTTKKRIVKKPAKKGTVSTKVIKKAVKKVFKAKKKSIKARAKRKPAPKTQGAPKGNQFWRARSSHGRNPIFKTKTKLWNACCEYFDWIEANPLKEQKVFHTDGKITYASVSKMRAMTLEGLWIFLDISKDTWYNYKERKGFLEVITRAESIIYNQKFTGASADLLNANIIARDLGLKDHKKISGDKDNPLTLAILEISGNTLEPSSD